MRKRRKGTPKDRSTGSSRLEEAPRNQQSFTLTVRVVLSTPLLGIQQAATVVQQQLAHEEMGKREKKTTRRKIAAAIFFINRVAYDHHRRALYNRESPWTPTAWLPLLMSSNLKTVMLLRYTLKDMNALTVLQS